MTTDDDDDTTNKKLKHTQLVRRRAKLYALELKEQSKLFY